MVGVIALARETVSSFSSEQIELVRTFADRPGSRRIENARLLDELRQRTNDLTKSLEQQTATSEVLQVISGSPGELEPVFAAMLASATRICEAKFGNLFLREAETFRAVAWHGQAHMSRAGGRSRYNQTRVPTFLSHASRQPSSAFISPTSGKTPPTSRFCASGHAR